MKKKIKKLYLNKKKRLFSKIIGTTKKPRLSVFKSNRYVYGQIINDHLGYTLVSYSTLNLQKDTKLTKNDLNKEVTSFYLAGKKLAIKAKEKGIEKIIFDVGNYKYHGQIKEFAEGARNQGLIF